MELLISSISLLELHRLRRFVTILPESVVAEMRQVGCVEELKNVDVV